MTDHKEMVIPRRRGNLVLMVYSIILFAMIGIIVMIAVNRFQVGTVLVWAFGGIFSLSVYNFQIRRRPVRVEVKDDGILLEFHMKADKFINWQEVSGINNNENQAGIRVLNEFGYYPMTVEAATALMNAYHEYTGKEVPVWYGKSFKGRSQ